MNRSEEYVDDTIHMLCPFSELEVLLPCRHIVLGGVRNNGGERDGRLLPVLNPSRFFGVVAGRRFVGVMILLLCPPPGPLLPPRPPPRLGDKGLMGNFDPLLGVKHCCVVVIR